MLILTRRPDEAIIIGNNIRLSIVHVRGNQVRISIDAPKEVPILREELLQRQANRGG